MVTIYDIAEATGYTAPTVSKALCGTGGLSLKTREKIIARAKEMGYTPNMAARSLATKKSYLIGVIYEDFLMFQGFEHPIFGTVLNEVRKTIEAAGYDLLFLSKQFNRMTYTEHCSHRNVDGVIIINPIPGDPDVLELAQSGIPCVSANEPIKGVCTVSSENTLSAKEAVDYIISCGHTRIAYIAAPFNPVTPASLERLNGYRLALREHGLAYDENLIEECPFWHSDAGYEGAKRLCGRMKDNPVTAIFAANDTLAFGVMRCLQEEGYRVPEDVSIVGFDDDKVSSYTTPALTTVRQDRQAIGDIAAEMLLNTLAGIPIPESVQIPTNLIIRASVVYR